MGHFLRITRNVLKFHLDEIVTIGVGIGLICGYGAYFIFNDKVTTILALFSAIAGQIFVAYYKEYQRFKEKGHY